MPERDKELKTSRLLKVFWNAEFKGADLIKALANNGFPEVANELLNLFK